MRCILSIADTEMLCIAEDDADRRLMEAILNLIPDYTMAYYSDAESEMVLEAISFPFKTFEEALKESLSTDAIETPNS